MRIRESLLRKSAIYGVVFQRSEPKKSFFNPGSNIICNRRDQTC